MTGQCRNGKPIKVDCRMLSVAAITAAPRYLAKVELDSTPATRDIVTRSREDIKEKLSNGVFSVTGHTGGPNSLHNLPENTIYLTQTSK